jgi:squalene-associated FAD-dependent desaturase
MAKRAIVVGAGWAGCAAAESLAQAGARVALVEARQGLGGRARGVASRGLALDNGQHLFLGAYHSALGLLARLGTRSSVSMQARLRVPFLLPSGGAALLACGPLPGLAGLLQGLFGYSALNGREKAQALGLGLWAGPELLQAAWGQDPASLQGLSAEAWLLGRGQGTGVCRKLWEPLGLAACNAALGQAPASLFAAVLAQGFFKGGQSAGLGFSQVPLDELLAPLPALLRSRGGELRLGAKAIALEFEQGRPVRLLLQDGQRLAADAFVLALPALQAAALLPADIRRLLGLDAMASLASSAIASAYLLCRKPLLKTDFGAFLDLEQGQPGWHWAFDKGPAAGGHLHCFVSSAAAHLAGLSREALQASLCRQLAAYLPGFEPAEVMESIFVVERSATPLFTPASLSLRPRQATGIPGLGLAGDWTDTGLPATLEGAVRSGQAAAEWVA